MLSVLYSIHGRDKAFFKGKLSQNALDEGALIEFCDFSDIQSCLKMLMALYLQYINTAMDSFI